MFLMSPFVPEYTPFIDFLWSLAKIRVIMSAKSGGYKHGIDN